jgi:N-methylhydantoinase B/oxoprolinase/acetone carboxylase alpha subunit
MGRNTWVKQARAADGDLPEGADENTPPAARYINIGGKATIFMGKGDRLLIETPGAGAWGAREGEGENEAWKHDHSHVRAWAARGSLAERERAQAGF